MSPASTPAVAGRHYCRAAASVSQPRARAPFRTRTSSEPASSGRTSAEGLVAACTRSVIASERFRALPYVCVRCVSASTRRVAFTFPSDQARLDTDGRSAGDPSSAAAEDVIRFAGQPLVSNRAGPPALQRGQAWSRCRIGRTFWGRSRVSILRARWCAPSAPGARETCSGLVRPEASAGPAWFAAYYGVAFRAPPPLCLVFPLLTRGSCFAFLLLP